MSRFFIDNFAIDLSKKALTTTDVYDNDAIMQSVQNIILTIPGERVFQPEFGSILMASVFRNLNNSSGEKLLDSVISSIERFEQRVKVVSDECQLIINTRENSVTIVISFYILATGSKKSWTKKLAV